MSSKEGSEQLMIFRADFTSAFLSAAKQLAHQTDDEGQNTLNGPVKGQKRPPSGVFAVPFFYCGCDVGMSEPSFHTDHLDEKQNLCCAMRS